jgi:general secretion pathway protein A
MYASFFGLREQPFDLTPNPRFLVLTDAHREALSNLEYAIAGRRGITVLIGEAGTGKTTLIRAALQGLRDRVFFVHLHNPALTRDEFVEMLAVQFQFSDAARQSKAALLTELEALLRARQASGEATVLVVDEAQSIPIDLLEEIRLLGNIETEDTKLLSIILTGQPELGTLLQQDSLRQLRQRIGLRCELRPLTQGETAGYLAGRIRAAGGVGAQVFTREAVVLIHQRSGGIPRTISVIADNALVTAYALGRKPVNSEIVTEVCRDLAFESGAAAHTKPSPALPVAPAPVRPAPDPLLSVERPTTAGHSEPVDDDPGAGLFNNMYPRRRRFSIFSRSGS